MTTLSIRDFPQPVLKWLKVQAAKESITLKELIIRIAREYLDKNGDEGWMEESE